MLIKIDGDRYFSKYLNVSTFVLNSWNVLALTQNQSDMQFE